MKKHITLLVLSFAMVLSSISIAKAQENTPNSEDGSKLTIISGFKGGSYYTMAMDMQKMTRQKYGTPIYKTEVSIKYKLGAKGDTLMDENGMPITEEIVKKTPTGDTLNYVTVKDSDGAYYNFLKINKVDADITFLQYDVLLYESMKDLKRTIKKTDNIRVLLPLGSEQIHLITLKKNNIKDFKQLKGKRVGIGSSLQGTNTTATFIKEKTGGKWEDVEIAYDKAFKALFDGNIEAFFFVGNAPIKDLADISKAMKDQLQLIALPATEELKNAYGEQVEINNSMYPWVDQPVKTYAVKSLLVTSLEGQTPEKEEAIKNLLLEVKQNKDKAGYHKSWQKIEFKKDPEIEWEYHKVTTEVY